MHRPRHPLTPNAAYILAAKLRTVGVYATGRDILTRSRRTVRAACLWLETIQPRTGRNTWETFMGADLPPPSQHSWPQHSAHGHELGGAG